MGTPLLLGKDANGNVNFGLPVCDYMVRVELAAATAVTMGVPLAKTKALFTYSNAGDVWVDYQATATLPSGGFAFTTAELRPLLRFGLVPGANLSFICPTTAYVHISFWE